MTSASPSALVVTVWARPSPSTENVATTGFQWPSRTRSRSRCSTPGTMAPASGDSVAVEVGTPTETVVVCASACPSTSAFATSRSVVPTPATTSDGASAAPCTSPSASVVPSFVSRSQSASFGGSVPLGPTQ